MYLCAMFSKIFGYWGRFAALVWLAVSALAVCGCGSDGGEDDADRPAVPAKKTLIVYLPWSKTLTAAFRVNVSRLEDAIRRHGLARERVWVFMSESAAEAHLYEIRLKGDRCLHDTVSFTLPSALDRPATVTAVIDAIKAKSPSESYSMVVGGHGLGWVHSATSKAVPRRKQRVPWEETGAFAPTRWFGANEDGCRMDIANFAKGISDSGVKMDCIVFDDCWMASLEAVYDLRHVADYVVGCPTEIMEYGMPYDRIGGELLGRTDYAKLVSEFYDFYSTYAYPYGTVSVTKCSELDALSDITAKICRLYAADWSDDWTANLQVYDAYSPAVFFDFADYMRRLCPDDALYAEFEAQLKRAVPYSAHTEKYYTSRRGEMDIRTFCGLSTSAPSKNVWASDVKATNWWAAAERGL